MMDKRARRRDCFDRIQSLSDAEKRAFSQTICEVIEAFPAFRSAKSVFAYAALPGEPDLQTLIENHREKWWAFPRVGEDNHLDFFQVSSPTEIIPGTLGIAEPDPTNRLPEEPSVADLILVPGVSFDPASRARLGRGKGHYDRYLGRSLTSPRHPVLIGVCFSIQFSALETEPHDIPMHRLVTEQGWVG